MDKPKFCQRCGANLSSASKEEIIPEQKEIKEETPKQRKTEIPEIDELEVEILHIESRAMTFGNLMETSSPDAKIDKFNKGKSKRVNKKKFWNDFGKEAGQLRDS
jgi:hypothetical protein